MTTLLPSLALSSKEVNAMSFYEISAPQTTVATRLLSKTGQKLQTALSAMQYIRLSQALARLSDKELALIGVKRAGIANFAHRAIYDE